MSDNLYEYRIKSNSTTDFLEPLATNECSADVEIMLPNKSPLWYLRAIEIVSKENLDYEVWLFRRAANLTGVVTTEEFIGMWQFNALIVGPPASPGYPVTVHGGSLDPLYHFYVDGNMMPIQDLDSIKPSPVPATPSLANAYLHVRLINRNAVSKTAGAGGALEVIFWVAAQRGW